MKKLAPQLKTGLRSGILEAGCDEAGRGPLAGPVFAAAVILPENFYHPLLNDSKKMTEKERNLLREVIEREAVSCAVASKSPSEIDEINILNASIKAMQEAVKLLAVKPLHLLIDGNRFKPMPGYEYTTVVGGDAVYASIAAASVLAKTHRDEFMCKLALEYPQYGWDKNMGYPTPGHIDAIRRYGLTPWHRLSFRPKALEPTLFENEK